MLIQRLSFVLQKTLKTPRGVPQVELEDGAVSKRTIALAQIVKRSERQRYRRRQQAG